MTNLLIIKDTYNKYIEIKAFKKNFINSFLIILSNN